jgi:hypothetical protein
MPPKREQASTKKKPAAKKKSVVKGSWIWCVGEARKKLKIEGFVAITKGSDLYNEAIKIKEEFLAKQS